MNIIAAVDSNWAIGYQNSLLVRIPRDQQMFREMTEGKVIVAGRRTLETFPQKQPLKNRVNIILSRDKRYTVKDAIVVHSIDELMEELKAYDDEDVYVVGGAGVYEQLLPYCDTAHITKIDYEYQADVFFPRLDRMPEWELTADSEEQTYFDLEYYFLKYERKNNRKC
ncbi:MAG: dihydrofolate reductase [Lachnospiraceae bacterium]|nr:dihydrofolate reductase [Lachnospiraceae bacterium]